MNPPPLPLEHNGKTLQLIIIKVPPGIVADLLFSNVYKPLNSIYKENIRLILYRQKVGFPRVYKYIPHLSATANSIVSARKTRMCDPA